MLLHREQVRHRLAGMAAVGQPVDDRNAGMAGKLQNLFVLEGPGHDPIAHARQNPGDILHRLAGIQAHFFTANHQPFAAQMMHGHAEADAGAQAGLFKDHGQNFSGQEAVVLGGGFELLFEPNGHVQHVLQIGGGSVGDAREVFHEKIH